MEVEVARKTTLGIFQEEDQTSLARKRDIEFPCIPGRRPSSSEQIIQQQASHSSGSAARQFITSPLLKKDDRSWQKSRAVLPGLLIIEVLLVHLSFRAPKVLNFVHAVKPEGNADSRGLDVQAERDMHKLPPTELRKANETPLPIPSVEHDLTDTKADPPAGVYETETDNQTTTSLPDAPLVSRAGEIAAASIRGRVVATDVNPWEGLLSKFDVPRVHGSGVKVDLGNEKKYGSKMYREPGGFCPVYGKFIQLFQPTRNPDIWPNDYLVAVPFAGTARDTMPLGGGFGLPIANISPLTLAQLKAHVHAADTMVNPHPYMMLYRRQIKDDLGYCVWWTRISPAQDRKNPSLPLDLRYRYSIAWDEKKKVCTLLYVNMQEMGGAGTYCTKGNDKPVLSWYCFTPMKTVDMKDRVWASPYTRMDHGTACPRKGLKHVHWGQWNGNECQKIAPRKRVTVNNAAQCAIVLFDNSPSDNPTQYVGDEGRGWDQIVENVPGVLFPAGSTGNDQPHSRGVGVNWANYYPKSDSGEQRRKSECEMYDGVPDCLTVAHGGFAFVSLASPDPEDATLPPCAPTLEGAFIGGPCKCPPGKRSGWKCIKGTWQKGEEDCTCEKKESNGGINAWVIAGPVVIGGALMGILGAYLITKRRRHRAPVQRVIIEDDTREHQVQQRKTQTDLLQEAEPSFWREAKDDDPTVVLYGDHMDQEF